MRNQDWEKQFNNIVQGLNIDIEDSLLDKHPTSELSSWEIRRAAVGMNEAATYLGRFLLQQTYEPYMKMNKDVTPLIREVIQLTNMISSILSECDCAYCQAEACSDCTDEMFCEDCMRAIEDELDEEL